MTASGTRASTRTWAVRPSAAATASAALQMLSVTSSVTSSARRAGRAGGRSAVYRGADLRYSMELTLDQAANGFATEIRVPSWETCDVCKGAGAKPGTSSKTCGTCNGSGNVRMSQGFFSIQQTCPTCRGSGKVIPDPCTNCQGAGRIKQNKVLEVSIPAGIDEGQRIRLSGKGEPGTNGGPPGDLYVEIHIKPHEVFQRDGDDLHCEVPIGFPAATLGGEIEVPTLGGKATINVTEGTQTGKTFRLARQGHQGRARELPGRSVLPHRGRDSCAADRQAEEAAARVRCFVGRGRREAFAALEELRRQDEGLFYRRVTRGSPLGRDSSRYYRIIFAPAITSTTASA